MAGSAIVDRLSDFASVATRGSWSDRASDGDGQDRCGWDANTINATQRSTPDRCVGNAAILCTVATPRARLCWRRGLGDTSDEVATACFRSGYRERRPIQCRRHRETTAVCKRRSRARYRRAAMSAPWIFNQDQRVLRQRMMGMHQGLSEKWNRVLRTASLAVREWGRRKPQFDRARAPEGLFVDDANAKRLT